MYSKILQLLLTLSFPLGIGQQISFTPPQGEPVEQHFMYFPFISKPPLPRIQVVETAITYDESPVFPWFYSHCSHGYVESLEQKLVYDAVVSIEVYHASRYDIPPYTSTVAVQPAFPVTVPGHLNPYSCCVGGSGWAGGSWINGYGVFDAGHFGPEVYYPVTIVQYAVEDGNVLGFARNDTNWTLCDVRVISFCDTCSWSEQQLEYTTLQPGEVVSFQGQYSGPILSLVLIGQGKTIP